MSDFLNRVRKISEKINDEESKNIFNARLQLLIDGDWYRFFDSLQKSEYRVPEFDEFYKDFMWKKIIIYGAGKEGIYTKKLLQMCGYNIEAFCDSDKNKWYKQIEGVTVIPSQELCEMRDYVIIIASRNFVPEIYQKLLFMGINRNNIFYPMNRFVMGRIGWQYFDLFTSNRGEVFIDAGAYNGMTTVEFAQWSHNCYNKIYLFEANVQNKNMCEKVLLENNIQNYKLIMKGTWDKKDKLQFDCNSSTGSRIIKTGSESIFVTSIDEELGGESVTFIKMDVEGSEHKTIIGAANTLKKYKPRLAISAYHMPEDFINLPFLLLEINDDYEIAFRHYSSCPWETVLYAW